MQEKSKVLQSEAKLFTWLYLHKLKREVPSPIYDSNYIEH